MTWRNRARKALARLYRRLEPPPPDQSLTIRNLGNQLTTAILELESLRRNPSGITQAEFVAELIEARAMYGTGPWKPRKRELMVEADKLIRAVRDASERGVALREAVTPIVAQGAYGDIELALQNVEWRREVNLSWLEFSRWGIQQIILISRLFYIKSPLIQRATNVAAHYVFGRGVELTSTDEAAAETLKEFVEDNQTVLGPSALADLQRYLYMDGQIFFAFFSDENSGKTKLRTIDATEIQEVYTNPDDTSEPWLYRREWWQAADRDDVFPRQDDQRILPQPVTTGTRSKQAWYPALGFQPDEKPEEKGGYPIMWDSPVIHFRGGLSVSKWHFDTPRVYAALDWARAAERFLKACATIRQSLAQISMHITTKGGQQAIEGIKQQLQTQVGPSGATGLWDTNPTAVNASILATGPGTTMETFNMRGAGGDPEEVRRFIHMVAMALDLPEHFFADVTTGALATAQTLDRPTELAFLEKQERWRQVLIAIGKHVLEISKTAPNGKLREALEHRNGTRPEEYRIVEAKRVRSADGKRWIEAKRKPKKNEIEVTATFPAILEGDVPNLVTATVMAMTLGGKGGSVTGIDEKAGVTRLMELLGIDSAKDIAELMYPDKEYDLDRTAEPEPAPAPVPAIPSSAPVAGNGDGVPPAKESLRRALIQAREAVAAMRDGTHAG